MDAQKCVLISGFFVRIIFPFVGIFFVSAIFSQSDLDLPEQLTADVIDTKGLTQKLAGNVKLRYKGVVLFCDQAVHNVSTHSVKAYGHVLVVQGDSITARGDSANFAYANRHLLMYGRVMFQDHRTTLTTTQFDYDLADGVVTYTQKARIVDEKNVLTSLKGTYNLQLKQFYCQQSVQLATRKNIVKAESLVYSTVTQRSDAMPKVIYPAVIEQRIGERKPVPRVTEVVTPALTTRRPIAEQAAAVVVAAPVAKPIAKAKPISNLLTAVPETRAKSTQVAITKSPRVMPTGNATPAKSGVTFSSEPYTASPSAKSPINNTYTAGLSDLERELNRKKRFH